MWFGWFGFNGGSQLALGSALDASAMVIVYVNTNLAAAAGVVVAMPLTQALYKKMDLILCLNGAIGGLVAADLQHHGIAMAASAALWSCSRCRCSTGSGSTTWSARFPPICGIWGTLAVGVFGAFLVQFAGVAAIGAFVFAVSPLDRSQGHDRRSARGRGGIGRPRPDRVRAGSVFGRGSQFG